MLTTQRINRVGELRVVWHIACMEVDRPRRNVVLGVGVDA